MEQKSQNVNITFRGIVIVILVLAGLFFIGVPFIGMKAYLVNNISIVIGLIAMGVTSFRRGYINSSINQTNELLLFTNFIGLLFLVYSLPSISSPDRFWFIPISIRNIVANDNLAIFGVIQGAALYMFLDGVSALMQQRRSTGLLILAIPILSALMASIVFAPIVIGVLGGIIILSMTPIAYKIQQTRKDLRFTLYMLFFLALIFLFRFVPSIIYASRHTLATDSAIFDTATALFCTIGLVRPIQYLIMQKKVHFVGYKKNEEVATSAPGTTPSL